MKVLVLGSQGMLGQELVRAFEDKEVIGWDRKECDVLSPACDDQIRLARPDLIINAVAYNDVDRAQGEAKELAYRLNAQAPGHLAAIADSIGAVFAHFGTDYVFDGSRGNYTETDQPNPLNEYGCSKLEGETAVLDSGARVYVIRLSRLFGRPAISEGGKKSFVDLMLDLASKKNHLNIVDEEITCPTYAPDLALATRRIINEYPPGLYHAPNSGSCTWYEFALEIFRLKGVYIDVTPVSGDAFPRPAKRPMNSSLVSIKYPAMRSWKDALAQYLISS